MEKKGHVARIFAESSTFDLCAKFHKWLNLSLQLSRFDEKLRRNCNNTPACQLQLPSSQTVRKPPTQVECVHCPPSHQRRQCAIAVPKRFLPIAGRTAEFRCPKAWSNRELFTLFFSHCLFNAAEEEGCPGIVRIVPALFDCTASHDPSLSFGLCDLLELHARLLVWCWLVVLFVVWFWFCWWFFAFATWLITLS